MTPREAYESAPLATWSDGTPNPNGGRPLRVRAEQLLSMVGHHTCCEVLVSSDFGLLPCPKAQVERKLRDEFFLRQVARLKAEKGLDVEVDVSLLKVDRVKHEAYRIWIHAIAAWTGEGTYYPVI